VYIQQSLVYSGFKVSTVSIFYTHGISRWLYHQLNQNLFVIRCIGVRNQCLSLQVTTAVVTSNYPPYTSYLNSFLYLLLRTYYDSRSVFTVRTEFAGWWVLTETVYFDIRFYHCQSQFLSWKGTPVSSRHMFKFLINQFTLKELDDSMSALLHTVLTCTKRSPNTSFPTTEFLLQMSTVTDCHVVNDRRCRNV
jgi:hypothetical protein